LKTAPYPPLAKGTVRYVGDAVAVVVAESPEQAADAVDLIEVDYEPLPVTVDPEQAGQARRTAAASGGAEQHRVPLDGRGRRCRCRVQQSGRDRARAGLFSSG
jgi:CO/xanthine dehydrogenase Mo-binding subunit